MTRVTLRTYGHPIHILGGPQKEIEFQGTTVRDLLDELVKVYGTPLRNILFPHGLHFSDMIYILINGTNLNYLDHLDTHLKDGDVVVLLPITAGG